MNDVIQYVYLEIKMAKEAYKRGEISIQELQKICAPLNRVAQFAGTVCTR